jgi:hypothetical protein
MNPAALPSGSDQDFGDGMLEAEMRVGRNQSDPAQATADELAEEGSPELEVLGRAHVHTHDFTFAGGLVTDA